MLKARKPIPGSLAPVALALVACFVVASAHAVRPAILLAGGAEGSVPSESASSGADTGAAQPDALLAAHRGARLDLQLRPAHRSVEYLRKLQAPSFFGLVSLTQALVRAALVARLEPLAAHQRAVRWRVLQLPDRGPPA